MLIPEWTAALLGASLSTMNQQRTTWRSGFCIVADPAVSWVLPLCCSDERRAEVTAPAPDLGWKPTQPSEEVVERSSRLKKPDVSVG
jgi:hypothetical protein